MFRTALTGRCDARPDLAAAALPLQISVPALPCRGGTDLLTRVFEPLGWQVRAAVSQLDPQFPQWGESRYLAVTLTGEQRLADALNHLYVLLPVLDDAKHYWVTADEVDKLIRAGTGWLAAHPEKDLITRRYLAHRRELTRSALARLAEVDDASEEELDNATEGAPELPAEAASAGPAARTAPGRRYWRSSAAAGARRVGDLGCGEGALTADLLADSAIEHVTATDVSARALQHRRAQAPARPADRAGSSPGWRCSSPR